MTDRFHVVHDGKYQFTADASSYVVIQDVPGASDHKRRRLDENTQRIIENAADNPGLAVMDLLPCLTAEEDYETPKLDKLMNEPTIFQVAEKHNVNVDELITKYAERLQDIYDFQNAGSYTFSGVLALFLMELEGR